MSTTMPLPVEYFPRRAVAAGEVVFLEGQPAECAFVILNGEVEVVASGAGGAPVVVNHLKAGQMFGEIALLQPGGTRTATIVSEKGCDLIEIDRKFFDQSLAKSDPLLRYVVGHLCQRLVALTMRAADDTKP